MVHPKTMNIINEADSSREEDQITESEKCAPDPHAKQENDSTATQDNA